MADPLVSDVIKWGRRILKSPNTQNISDATMLDYLDRFYLYDMPYQIQQFDLKANYSFETVAFVDRYNMPIGQYNSILLPAYCDGYQIIMQQSNDQFNKLFPSLYFNANSSFGAGNPGPYNFFVNANNGPGTNPGGVPFIRGYTDVLGNLIPAVYLTADDVNGNHLVVTDDGNGNLVGDVAPGPGNTVNYLSGEFNVIFPAAIPAGIPIRTQTIPYTAGRPQAVNYYNNTFTLRPVPDRPYLITFDAYLTPSAFLGTGESVKFSWIAEYLARGMARKIMQDMGDTEQLGIYDPMFFEQEAQVLRRTYRQRSNVRNSTLYSGQTSYNSGTFNQI